MMELFDVYSVFPVNIVRGKVVRYMTRRGRPILICMADMRDFGGTFASVSGEVHE